MENEIAKIVAEIESSKKKLQGLLGDTAGDVAKALKLAQKILGNADKHLKEIEEYYVRRDLLNSGALKNTTTSYKFFWFRAIVEIISERDRQNSDDLRIDFRELFIRMLADAFKPTQMHKLSLGGQDKLAEHVKTVTRDFPKLTNEIGMGNSPETGTLVARFKTSNQIDGICTELKKNVPYAFLSAFTKEKMTDKNGNIDQKTLCEYATLNFENLPYKIDRESTNITVSENFRRFILSYQDVINGFIKSELTIYLEKRNPLVPNIAQKLDANNERTALTQETSMFKVFETRGNELIDAFDLKSVSFGDTDGENKPAIDHYIPWNFVAHNEIWNLSPMKSMNNSIKSDKLLTSQKSINCFVNQQWTFYTYLNSRNSRKPNNHKKYSDQYIPILQGADGETDFKQHLGNAIKQHQEIALSRGWQKYS